MGRVIWTYEKCKEEVSKKKPYEGKYNISNLKELAKNCRHRSEFSKMYSGAYKAAKKLNLLDELFPNKNVYSSKYSIDDIKEIAKNCIHRSEFQKMYSGVYKRAKKLNLLDELFPTEYVHTPHKWNYESCKELSKKYKKLQSLRDNHLGAYNAIKRYGWIDEFYPNRFKPKPRKEYPKLTYAVCKSICKNHNSVKELFDNDRPVWQVCRDNNWLSEFFDNYTKQERWTYSKCEKIANNYNSYTEFFKKERKVYDAINRMGWDDILQRLERTFKPHGYWNYERCKKEALKYSNKKEMEIHNASCKQIIQRNGWWELFDHMDELASLKKRYIYGFEFEDNHVYIGLSYNPEIRKEGHLRFDETSSVKKHIEKTNSKYVFKVLTNEPVDMNVAGKLEAEFIKKYKESGWVMLNKNRGGALGGKKGYTYNQCKNKVSEFKTLLEFTKEANGYYHKIKKMGWSELLNPLQRYTEYRGSKEYYLDNYPIVIRMIGEGRSNREIADATNNQMDTVWRIRKKFKEWNVNQYDTKFW